MAHRVRGFLRSAPVLLLTATPMQNSLAELWGLVQYVEPTGTLLGDINTFREVFCADDDRIAGPRPGARAATATRARSSSARSVVRRRSSWSGRSRSAAAGSTSTR